jgi:O-antigen/teichoic acid export membrane protein
MASSRRKTLFFTFIYKGLYSFIAFISSAVVARYLSRADRGEFQLAGTYQQTGMTIFGGFMNYYAFAVRKRPNDTKEIIQAGNFLVYTASILLWLITIALYYTPIHPIHLSRVWFFALIAMGFTFINGYGTRLLNALDEQAWLNRMNLAQPLLFLIIFVPLWLDKGLSEPDRLMWTYNLWILSFLIAVGVTMVVTYRLLRREGVLKWRLSLRELKGTLNFGGWSSVAQGTSYFALRMGYWFLQSNKDIMSIYGIAMVAAEVLNTLSGSITQLVFARMTGSSRDDAIALTQTSTRQTLLSSCIVAVGMYITFPWLLVLAFGSKYYGAILPFCMLLPGYVLQAAEAIVMQYFTNSVGKPIQAVWRNLLYIAVNAVFIAILSKFLNPLNTVAVATTLSSLVAFLTYVWWFSKDTGQPGWTLWKIQREDFRPYREVLQSVLAKVKPSK